MKRSLLTILCLGLLIATPPSVSALQLELVDANGSLKGTFPGLDQEKSVMADLDDFFNSLGYTTSWNSSIERMEVSNETSTFRFRPGSGMIHSPDNNLSLSSKPIKKNGNLYLDVEALVQLVSKHSKHSMIWNEARRQVQLRDPGNWSASPSKSEDNSDPIGEFIQEKQPEDDKLLVVVDPGHGGRDPGAIGSNGLYEKKVVLDMGLKLQQVLQEQYSEIKVRMTRESDRFIPLQKRTQIANQLNADVFVSLHANSARTTVAKGFEVFTLSGEASDPSSKELAEIENSALRYEGYSRKELDDVSWILWQLRSTIHTRKSRVVAGSLVDAMDNKLSIQSRGMKQAPFWVLKDARMPAVLVETGFLSNPEEAQRLADETYQRKVARAIAQGISQFRKNQSGS